MFSKVNLVYIGIWGLDFAISSGFFDLALDLSSGATRTAEKLNVKRPYHNTLYYIIILIYYA